MFGHIHTCKLNTVILPEIKLPRELSITRTVYNSFFDNICISQRLEIRELPPVEDLQTVFADYGLVS